MRVVLVAAVKRREFVVELAARPPPDPHPDLSQLTEFTVPTSDNTHDQWKFFTINMRGGHERWICVKSTVHGDPNALYRALAPHLRDADTVRVHIRDNWNSVYDGHVTAILQEFVRRIS